MASESLSKKEIDALLSATTRKEERPIYDKIKTDPFSVISNDYWMREASITLLENVKMENFHNLSKKISDKLTSSESKLIKEILSAIFSEVIKSKNFADIKLGKKIEFEMVPAKKIRKQFKPGSQCFYGNFSGRIQGIYSIVLTNDTTLNIVKTLEKSDETRKLNHLNGMTQWFNSVMSLFTEMLSLKIGEVKTSETYQAMATKSDQLILPEGSNYFKIQLELQLLNEFFAFEILFSVYNAKNIINHIIQLNPNVKRNIKSHHRIIRSIESKLNRFMKNRDTYLNENEELEIIEFIGKSLSKEERELLLLPLKDKTDKSEIEIDLKKIILSLSNEIIDRRYKINEAEKERKEKLFTLISTIPFPVNIRFEDEVYDYKSFKERPQNNSNIEKFINRRGSIIFSNKSLQEIILKKENEKLFLYDLTDNIIPSNYELHLTNLELMNLELEADIEIGKTKLPLDKLLHFKPGNVIELNKDMNDPVHLVIENVIFAKTTVVVSNEKFGVWIEDIANPNETTHKKREFLNKEEILNQTKIPMADIRVILSKLKLTIKDLLNMSKGSIIELDKSIFEPVQIIVGYDLIFPGEIIALENGKFGVRFVNNIGYSQQNNSDITETEDKLHDSFIENPKLNLEKGNSNPFSYLENIDPNTIYGILENEDAQMIAMILSFLSAEKSASILAKLNEKLQSNIVAKIAIGQAANPEIARIVANVLEKKLTSIGHEILPNVPGFDAISKILNSSNSENRSKMISALKKNHPDIYNILKSNELQE